MVIITKKSKPQCNSYNKGLALEKIAALYLQEKGLSILQHNFHCKFGEIDLICKNENELIFVEVRYRKNNDYGHPEETINFAKKKKILLAAQHYLTQNIWAIDLPCRIDVIAMVGCVANLNIKWIQNAIYM